jgi:thiol-disulfide isomerase/thioredoxin
MLRSRLGSTTRRWSSTTRGAAVLVCLFALAGCSGLDGTGGKQYIAGNGQVIPYAVAERGNPVELTGTSLDGQPLDTSAWSGKPLVVNLWWSGCVPCRTEMPMLVKAASELQGKAQFLGINIRDYSPDQGLAFAREKGVTYPSIYDPAGKALLAFQGKVSPRTIPTTIVLDAQHRVAATIQGEVPSLLTLTEVVDEIVGQHG